MPDLVLDPHASQSHTTIVKHLAQQKRSRLLSAVTFGTYRGYQAEAVNHYGPRKSRRTNERNGDTPLSDQSKSRRWVSPELIEDGDLIERQDELDAIFDFANNINKAMVMGNRREVDLQIIEAFFADAQTGQKGTETTAFSASQVVAKSVGGANTSLNVAKLRAVRKLLGKAEVVDTEDEKETDLFGLITADEHDALLGDIQATSKDFNSQPVLENGRILRFMGFTFIHSEQLGVTSNTRDCPFWHKDGMHYGEWEAIHSSLDRRPDKKNNVQIYVRSRGGATRLEEKRVVKCQTHVA